LPGCTASGAVPPPKKIRIQVDGFCLEFAQEFIEGLCAGRTWTIETGSAPGIIGRAGK